jgi:hypothetical protein
VIAVACPLQRAAAPMARRRDIFAFIFASIVAGTRPRNPSPAAGRADDKQRPQAY